MPGDVETQLRALGRQLDSEVAHIDADEILGAGTTLDLEPNIEPSGERHRARFIIAAAALAAAAAAIAAMVILRDDTRPGEERVASDTAAAEELLAPPAELSEFVVTRAAHGRTTPRFIRGAVQTPSGEIIGVTIHGGSTGGGSGGTGGPAPIEHVRINVGKGAVSDVWGYSTVRSCFSGRPGLSRLYGVSITMSDGLETLDPFAYTPPELETFFEQLTIPDTTEDTSGDSQTVTIQLPPGWESLGTTTASDRYLLQFSAKVATIDFEFELDQRPATGVGVFLADPGSTNPQPTTLSGRPAWLLTSRDGWTTLVFDDDGTAVALRARGLDEQELVAFAATLERRPWSETSALVAGTNPTQMPLELLDGKRLLPADCAVSLEIL